MLVQDIELSKIRAIKAPTAPSSEAPAQILSNNPVVDSMSLIEQTTASVSAPAEAHFTTMSTTSAVSMKQMECPHLAKLCQQFFYCGKHARFRDGTYKQTIFEGNFVVKTVGSTPAHMGTKLAHFRSHS
jgi:hypothetical protein